MYGMGSRRGAKTSTKALLEKVSSQLSGKIIQDPPSDDNDDLNAYLKSLNKKKTTPSQPKWDKYDEASDLSLSEDDAFELTNNTGRSTVASKFLKKKSQPTNEPQPKQGKTNDNTYTGSAITGKLTSYTAKYGSQIKTRMSTILSDSDLDMNISMDEDVLADVQSWKKKPTTKDTKTHPQESDDSIGVSIGHGGRRFLKKKQSQAEQEEKSVKDYSKKGKSSPSGNRRHYSSVHSDIDDNTISESLSRSHVSSSHSPTPPKNKPKRKTNNQKRSIKMNNESVEKSGPSHSLHGRVIMAFSGDSLSGDDDIKLNIMELDDLEPVMDVQPSEEKVKMKATYRNSDTSDADDDGIFNLINLQTVDDLVGAGNELSVASEVKTEVATSEIQTEPYESDFEAPSTSGKASTPLKSILATPRSPKTTPRSARGRVRYSFDDDVKIRSRSPSPEVISTAHGSEVSSVIHTRGSSEATEISSARSVPEPVDGSGSETYTEDYSEDFSSPSSHSIMGKSCVSQHHRRGSDMYSDDFLSGTDFDETTKTSHSYSRHTSRESFSDDYTSYTESSRSRTPSPDMKRKKSQKHRNRKVQTGLDLGLPVSAILGAQYGMALVPPTPIATHVVSPEALEAVTAYSPSVLALNDLLKQQLGLMRHFLETQKRLHDSYASMVPPDYQYMTLAETKRYIKQHRRKTITFNEALTQVKAEMGIK